MATKRLGKDVLDLEQVRLGFGGRCLFDDVTWRLGPGDRWGVVGANGSGKTTLLGLLAGRLSPDAGRVKRGKTVAVAVLSQDVAELDEFADLRAIDVIERERRVFTVGGKEVSAASMVERLGFTRERAFTAVRDLSGGERRRLQFLRLLVGEPNVLLLDEPTNDLDTDTLSAMEDLLDGWPGTLVVVSHDRYLLERVADRQVAVTGDGVLRDLPGGVEEYLALRRAQAQGAGVAGTSWAPSGSVKPGSATSGPGTASPYPTSPLARSSLRGLAGTPGSGKMATGQDEAGGASEAPASSADVRAAKKELVRSERRLAKIATQESRIHGAMAANATDHVAVTTLDRELTALAAEKAELEESWLVVADLIG
jgi:ABC-type multidrug transport system ATPase subunit